MARPCNVIDPEEHYQRLERLLTELYLVLRTLIQQGLPLLPMPHQQYPPPPPPSSGDSSQEPSSSRSGGRRCRENRPGRGGRRPDDDHQSGGPCNHSRQRTCCNKIEDFCESCCTKEKHWEGGKQIPSTNRPRNNHQAHKIHCERRFGNDFVVDNSILQAERSTRVKVGRNHLSSVT
ncbi:uncharacterized protein LOC132198004 [Neocloeon triangulifer]|uniref:uncharacterized protein LOC132198004 n=1 Tax=Neocloeon triangulifer TaxID=2078957 RepID=UPI00286EEFB0|nr:uncharacterized protein LOC132198004 [Neocloeon triangulifer]